MNALPLQFLMLIVAGWANWHQRDVIEYLQGENRALREQLGGKRLRVTDRQRRRRPVLNRVLGQSQGDLASLHRCPVVFEPIVDSIFRLVLGMDSGVHAEKVARSAIGRSRSG